jgi:hypothetical protein
MAKTAAPKGAVQKAAGKKSAAKKSAAPKSAVAKPKKPVAKKPAAKPKKPAAKGTRAPRTRKSQQEQGSEDENEGEEPEEEPMEPAEEENDVANDTAMPDAPADNDPKPKDDRMASKRSGEKRRSRGYRHVSTRGGYSAAYANSDQSRDVAANFISINETKRAARWKPQIDGVAVFENVDEYKERLAIANEPLPDRAAEVYRANLEVFMRKLQGDALQTAFDAGSKKLKPEHVMPHTRKLQKHLKYTVTAPHGVIRFAQLQNDGERLRIPTADQEALATDDPQLVENQKDAIDEQEEANKVRENLKLERIAKSKKQKAAAATSA